MVPWLQLSPSEFRRILADEHMGISSKTSKTRGVQHGSTVQPDQAQCLETGEMDMTLSHGPKLESKQNHEETDMPL